MTNESIKIVGAEYFLPVSARLLIFLYARRHDNRIKHELYLS